MQFELSDTAINYSFGTIKRVVENSFVVSSFDKVPVTLFKSTPIISCKNKYKPVYTMIDLKLFDTVTESNLFSLRDFVISKYPFQIILPVKLAQIFHNKIYF